MLKPLKHFKYYEPDGSGGGSDDPPKTPKTYSEDEFEKVVGQRQTLKTEKEGLETEIADLKSQLKELQDADAERKGDLEKLLNDKKIEIEDLTGQLNSVKGEADNWKKYKESRIESVKKEMGDKWRESYANLPLEDLEALPATLAPPKVPDTDGGGGKEDAKTVSKNLTAEEKAKARMMNVSDETYAYLKIKKEKGKE